MTCASAKRLRARLVLVGALALTGTLAGGLSGTAGATSPPAGRGAGYFDNPSANTSPAAGLNGSGSPCTPSGGDRWAACNALILGEINAAQAKEHARRLILPSNFLKLTPAQQLFVWIDLERVVRGVPPLVGLSPALDAAATKGLKQPAPEFAKRYGPVTVGVNPQTHGYGWSSFEGTGSSIPMAGGLVFELMYDDGWGGARGPFGGTFNSRCTSARSTGCWSDRDALLGSTTGTSCTDCVAGAASGNGAIGAAFAALIVQPAAYPVPLGFSWNADVLPYLPSGYEHVRARPRPAAPPAAGTGVSKEQARGLDKLARRARKTAQRLTAQLSALQAQAAQAASAATDPVAAAQLNAAASQIGTIASQARAVAGQLQLVVSALPAPSAAQLTAQAGSGLMIVEQTLGFLVQNGLPATNPGAASLAQTITGSIDPLVARAQQQLKSLLVAESQALGRQHGQ